MPSACCDTCCASVQPAGMVCAMSRNGAMRFGVHASATSSKGKFVAVVTNGRAVMLD